MWKNSLCIDPECTSAQRCCHMGPQGQLCYFNREKTLCELLGLDWKPDFTFDHLIDQLRHRLSARNVELDHLTTSIADRMSPFKDLAPPSTQLARLRDSAKDDPE